MINPQFGGLMHFLTKCFFFFNIAAFIVSETSLLSIIDSVYYTYALMSLGAPGINIR